jgi:hypothetical protein
MASIIPVGDKWRAQVRRKGHEPQTQTQTQTFEKKADAEKWARRVESEIEAGRARHTGQQGQDHRRRRQALPRGGREDQAIRPRQGMVLPKVEDKKEGMGSVVVSTLSVARIVRYITEQRKVQGVTASIDLTYLGGVLKLARTLWHIDSPRGVVDDARETLRHMNLLARSNERDRRPTDDELDRLRAWFSKHSRSLKVDIFDFILDSCFRPPSEITRLRWADLNEEPLRRDARLSRQQVRRGNQTRIADACTSERPLRAGFVLSSFRAARPEHEESGAASVDSSRCARRRGEPPARTAQRRQRSNRERSLD